MDADDRTVVVQMIVQLVSQASHDQDWGINIEGLLDSLSLGLHVLEVHPINHHHQVLTWGMLLMILFQQ